MVRSSLLSRLKRLLAAQANVRHSKFNRAQSTSKQSTWGFTLIEVLVVAAIAGGLVTGLMFIVVQLMQADQRESARTETQREMQLAMDYVSDELREAVFVYTGDYLPTLAQYLPDTLTAGDSVPVVAFWRQQAFPETVRTACASASPPAGVGCMSGQSYSLVVYSLTRNPSPRPAGSPWRGGARITRYALTQFQGNSTTVTPGYVNPGDQGNFVNWPFFSGTNLQTARGGRPTATAGTVNTLVDFVDREQATPAVRCPGDNPAVARKPYSISPPDGMLDTAFGAGNRLRSFYACVSSSRAEGTGTSLQNLQTTGSYQDVLLYLRGSAVGRPGIPTAPISRSAELLPTLETRIMLQGVLTREPPS
ncbi:prepilin-type N-terminal cleavage/methylation domain-containing protein [Leptolyngbya ohadii]|uniref:prepilin-type N-terminal cleavage/methylation domain-containing protein n=1 Tax=Leptolyngbya ohadii TaxID=1962290 RepID=UPI000B5999BD|nr:prepilin-type N-terminal cleavage/methylation domain-containing protein [Leptolyngbya ohadii]